jgi:FixJ family two-component response regulator
MNATKTTDQIVVSIVDDDISVRRSTQRLLRCSGFRAESFSSAEEFLGSDLVGETSCLLLDVRMPNVNGLELQRRLTEAGNTIPIIFMSAHASEEEERSALDAGAIQFLRKPISKAALLSAIDDALKSPGI